MSNTPLPPDNPTPHGSLPRTVPGSDTPGRGLRPEILRILDDLRRRIRRYVLLEGIAAVLVLLGVLFWFSLGVDVAWFQISKLELPLWFRRVIVVAACGLFALTLVTWIGFRYLRRFRMKALALVLERRFPELDDRLVTAVELADSSQEMPPAGLGGAMLERTVSDAVERVSRLDLGSVFDRRPLRRTVIAAAVLVASIFGFGLANADAMHRWYAAYVAGVENYWDAYRRSEMSVQVLAPPGDRVREFNDEFVYKHPRGADLTLLVTVQEGKEIPDRVTLRHLAVSDSGSSRGSTSMSRAGERQFRHTISRVIDNHELWIVGGDYTNRVPFRVQVVDPPRIDRMTLDVDYPSYTGMDALEDQPVLVQGARQALPVESSFVLRAESNKPLTGVEIRTERFALTAAWQKTEQGTATAEGTLSIIRPSDGSQSSQPLPKELLARLLAADRRSLTLPLHLTMQAETRLDRMADATSPADLGTLPLPPDSRLQITLTDEDDVVSLDPASVALNAIPDEPPVIDVVLSGIGSRITRLATIPFRGRIVDDYGVREAWFQYQLDSSDVVEQAPLVKPPRGETRFELQRSEREKVERFDVLPLQLDPGRKLTLSLNARDGDDINGPHETQGQLFTMTIVMEDELRADLYDKEMHLRLRFELLREDIDQIRTDLLLNRGRYTESLRENNTPLDSLPAAEAAAVMEKRKQLQISLQAGSDRSLNRIRKDHSESREVEQRFRDIREEMVNNRIDTEAARSRLDDGILNPLARLNADAFPRVDESLGLLSLTIERGQNPTSAIDTTVVELDRILAGIDAILAQMSERRDFNELLQEFQSLVERHRKTLEETEKERQRSVIESLFD